MAKPHTSQEFESELNALRHSLLLMAGYCETMISDGVKAFMNQDALLAKRTIKADSEVNRLEVEIDDQCLRIMARRQPVAGDLRLITKTLKMVTDLERIGDLAVDICERALRLQGTDPIAAYDDIATMGVIARRMISDAIDAFVNRDSEKARKVLDDDEEVDELYVGLCRQLMSVMQDDQDKVERGIHTMSVAKFLERIGDHATNIAEQVIFMVEGEDVRHEGKLPARIH